MDVHFETSTLDYLRSKGEGTLLDAIDTLRSQGIGHYVSLPQLIVCGDQSSGKSSVLEAISGIPFPTRDNMCTRFATEVILRRSSVSGVSVSINPAKNRTEVKRQSLLAFSDTMKAFEDLPELIEQAKEAMGLTEMTNAFAEDVLRIEISGPDRPHLTIVDLPGLIHAENKVQKASDVDLVQQMVKSYMANKRSIILAVISAKNDYANQIILKLARDIDSGGLRTLGVITKPDMLPVGSESEESFANLAQNQDIEFRLGWHVLRNRDYEHKHSTTAERDAAEKQFFSTGIWAGFSRSSVGIDSLRSRLSRVLLDQIRNELPDLVKEIESHIRETREALDRLGRSRRTLDEQRLFLLKISQSYQVLVKAACDGMYGDAFFGNSKTDEGYSRRLRAVIQNMHMAFAETMRLRGHKRHFVDKEPTKSQRTNESKTMPEIVLRTRFLDEIAETLKRTRGRELPGMYSPLIIGDLFYEQASPWKALAESHLKDVWEATQSFLDMVISNLTDEDTAEVLLLEVIGPQMEEVLAALEAKLQELFLPYQTGHPITYNHYFTETIQNMRHRRMEDEVARRLSKFFNVEHITSLEELPNRKVKSTSLVTALSQRNEADMNRYASSEILDCMLAYYKVALKCVVDNVANYAVEINLVQKLEGFFSPSRIIEMSPDLVHKIAVESPSAAHQREQLSRKLEILNAGMETCRRYAMRGGRKLQSSAEHRDLSVLDSLDLQSSSEVDIAMPDVHSYDGSPIECSGQPLNESTPIDDGINQLATLDNLWGSTNFQHPNVTKVSGSVPQSVPPPIPASVPMPVPVSSPSQKKKKKGVM